MASWIYKYFYNYVNFTGYKQDFTGSSDQDKSSALSTIPTTVGYRKHVRTKVMTLAKGSHKYQFLDLVLYPALLPVDQIVLFQ